MEMGFVSFIVFFLGFSILSFADANFNRDFDIMWGGSKRAKIKDKGRFLTLSMDLASGAAFQSKKDYIFGRFDMQIKLIPGNSAGTVTSFYLSSRGEGHDEIDFEFLGNSTGEPYLLHTNVFSRGGGGREKQFYLWFDPTADFHTYSIIWTPKHILFGVDGTIIRDFKNMESIGVPYPNKQRMRVYGSLWNADSWATRGGLVRTNWSEAPFMASYRNFRRLNSGDDRLNDIVGQELNSVVGERMKWVQDKYMVYDYCGDMVKHPRGLPAECVVSAAKLSRNF
ncbi:xyloglucan endotransglucosylase/hydrolase 2-like [Impatiens glandulifera]|uniref:xyloglucan endotransglucosylase/hydrolase 2-like n=1 Tax=Impatiens glandulifera TaxID=253017 RepID=UPI001FB0C869|nr:xyloglucan endotransglucosylase/hydrolase 2-like [Impatiens glandulifera]